VTGKEMAQKFKRGSWRNESFGIWEIFIFVTAGRNSHSCYRAS